MLLDKEISIKVIEEVLAYKEVTGPRVILEEVKSTSLQKVESAS